MENPHNEMRAFGSRYQFEGSHFGMVGIENPSMPLDGLPWVKVKEVSKNKRSISFFFFVFLVIVQDR